MTQDELLDLAAWIEVRRERLEARGLPVSDPQVGFLSDGRMCCPKCMSLSEDCKGHREPLEPYVSKFELPTGWHRLKGKPFDPAI